MILSGINSKKRFFVITFLFIGIAAMAQDHFERTGEPAVKFSLQSYSFGKLLNDRIKGRGEGISLEQLLDFAASQGFDAVDLTGYYFPGYPDVPSDDYIYSIKHKAFLLGLNISGTGVKNDFTTSDSAIRKESIQHVKDWIDVSAKLGTPVVRIFAGDLPENFKGDRQKLVSQIASCIKECAEYAGERGVFIGIQNHGNILKNAAQTIELIQLVDSQWFGVITDTGYYLTDDPYKDWEMLIPYTLNFLLKEHLAGGEKSPVELNKTMKILKEKEFRGYVLLETLSDKGKSDKDLKKKKYDPYAAMPVFFKEAKKAAKEIEIYKK